MEEFSNISDQIKENCRMSTPETPIPDIYSYFYSLVEQIPDGSVTTYGDLARALGDIRAARACGYMLSINPRPDTVPCYRVVHSDGTVGKFTHPLGSKEKVSRLKSSGVGISGDKIEDFEKKRFTEFDTDFPLKSLREEQDNMRIEISDDLDYSEDKFCAVDVSYSDFYAVGTAVIHDGSDIYSKSVRQDVNFPYIPGYLSYREFPFISSLCSDPDMLLITDGNGQLHYRNMGLATFAGIKLKLTSIGIAKSRLLGTLKGDYIYHEGLKLAFMANRREIISAGNGITLDESVKVIKKKFGLKYPSILKEAHNICTDICGKVKNAS